MKITVSTHILDTALGRPAAGVPVTLDPDATATARLVFAVRDYLVASHGQAFFPEVTVVFTVGPGEHYHVPLLLAPFGYSTYRGS